LNGTHRLLIYSDDVNLLAKDKFIRKTETLFKTLVGGWSRRREDQDQVHVCDTGQRHNNINTRVYPKVSGLATWNENRKWYSSLPLDAVVSLFCESV